EAVRRQDAPNLLDVGRRVRLDLGLREARPGGRLARRVADLSGEVADDEHGDVAELLELAQLAQDDREAEVDVGRGRVDAELHPEGHAAPELAAQVRLGDDVDRARGQDPELLPTSGSPMARRRYQRPGCSP